MTEACKEIGLASPKFDLIGGGLRVSFQALEAVEPVKTRSGALNGALNQRIFQVVSDQPGIQRKDLIDMPKATLKAWLDEPSRTLDRVLKDLQERGLVERRGSKKTGGTYVVEGEWVWPLIKKWKDGFNPSKPYRPQNSQTEEIHLSLSS